MFHGFRKITLAKRLRVIAFAALAITALLILLRPNAAYASTMRFVSNAGFDGNNPCVPKSFPCLTIKHALKEAAAGDTISVAAGTYHEHFTIGKDIQIVGAGQSSTFITGHGNVQPYRMILVNSHTHVTLSHLTITGGYLNNDVGAGILNKGDLTLDAIALTSNSIGYNTPGEGGGIYNSYGAPLKIKSSLLRQNSARDEGGAIYNAGHLEMTNSQVKSNFVFKGGLGGGLADVGGGTAILTDDTFESNEAVKGGGIFVYTAALTLRRVTLKANFATQRGGGLYTEIGRTKLTDVAITGNTAYSSKGSGEGGGIFSTNSTLTVNRVAFDNNDADNVGGALFNANNADFRFPSTLTNATFHSNSTNPQIGQDIYNGDFTLGPGALKLKNVTIFEPTNHVVGQAIFSSKGKVTLKNSIVSTYPENTACSSGGQGTIVSLGHNLGDTYCGLDSTKHDRIGVNPKLSTFGNHGGFTKTFPLRSDSPAIDYGANKGCPATDQRGVARPIDGDGNGTATCDIGAYEFDPNPQ